MDGARDSEIAMGAFQPHHLTSDELAKGQIHAFRKALWHEHLGGFHNFYLNPQNKSCIEKVKNQAGINWESYTKEKFYGAMEGHLLPYPVQVTNGGGITTLEEFEFFPDTKAPVLGTRSEILPPILTT